LGFWDVNVQGCFGSFERLTGVGWTYLVPFHGFSKIDCRIDQRCEDRLRMSPPPIRLK
jgi:hypothetical protein